MNGRDFYRIFSPILTAISFVFAVLPGFVTGFLWSAFSFFQGKLASLLRYLIIKPKFKSLGKNVYFGSSVVLKNIRFAKIGENVSVHDFCYIDAVGGLEIGNNVSIAHASSIITFNHMWGDASTPIKYNPISLSPVVIGDDVWIGCGVRIMPGVSIGSRSIIAAGAIVTSSVEPGSLVAGVPARLVRKII